MPSEKIRHFKFPEVIPARLGPFEFHIGGRSDGAYHTLWAGHKTTWFSIPWDEGAELVWIPEWNQFVYRAKVFGYKKEERGYHHWYGGIELGKSVYSGRHNDRFINLLVEDGEHPYRDCWAYEQLVKKGPEAFLYTLEPQIISSLKRRWRVQARRFNNIWAIPVSEERLQAYARSVRLLFDYRIKITEAKPDAQVCGFRRNFDGRVTNWPLWINGNRVFIGSGIIWEKESSGLRQRKEWREDLLDLRDGLWLMSASKVWTDRSPGI